MMKEVTKFFEIQSTKELVKVIMERESLNTQDSTYLKTRGKNGGTWMHPILFIDFAMWINPSFKYDVLKFVYDEMASAKEFTQALLNKEHFKERNNVIIQSRSDSFQRTPKIRNKINIT